MRKKIRWVVLAIILCQATAFFSGCSQAEPLYLGRGNSTDNPIYISGNFTDATGQASSTWEFVTATSDQIVNNSTTLVNHSELKFDVEANEDYMIHYVLRFNTTSAQDLRADFSIPSGGSIKRMTTSTATYRSTEEDGEVDMMYSGSGNDSAHPVNWFYYIGGANSGTVQFRFAQWSAGAVDTTVLEGSTMYYCKLN